MSFLRGLLLLLVLLFSFTSAINILIYYSYTNTYTHQLQKKEREKRIFIPLLITYRSVLCCLYVRQSTHNYHGHCHHHCIHHRHSCRNYYWQGFLGAAALQSVAVYGKYRANFQTFLFSDVRVRAAHTGKQQQVLVTYCKSLWRYRCRKF